MVLFPDGIQLCILFYLMQQPREKKTGEWDRASRTQKEKCLARKRKRTREKKLTPRRRYQSMQGGPRRVLWEHAIAGLDAEQMSVTSRDLAASAVALCSSNFPISDCERWRRRMNERTSERMYGLNRWKESDQKRECKLRHFPWWVWWC